VVVTLAADATLVNEQTQAKLTLADLTVGATVEVKGTVTPGATTSDPSTVTTSVVHVLPADGSGTAASTVPRLQGAGSITAVNGALLTVALNDANFLPSSNSIVVDASAARFTHGQTSDLAVGVRVHFVGKASGSGSTTVVASLIDVDGASSSPTSGEKLAAGVSGKVTAVASATSFTLTVTTGTAAVPAGAYSVDTSKAQYETGSASCLVVGAQVNVRGTVSGNTLTARQIEITGCAGQKHASPGRG